jgi:hypothetical protein
MQFRTNQPLRASRRSWKALVALLALTLLAACGLTGRPMTPNEVAEHGTLRVNAPADRVFTAAQGALKSEGYQVAVADPSKGLIKTNRKMVRVVAQGGSYSAQAIEITRQYVVTLRSDGAATVVTAEPRVFQGDRDLSDEAVWDLEGPMGERKLWSQFFRDLKEGL